MVAADGGAYRDGMLLRILEVYLVGGPVGVSVAVPLLVGALLLRRRPAA